MSTLVILVHIIVCVALILIVLLQTGKGADMGAAFGGGSSQTLFGSTGASSFLSRLTTGAAIVFMLTSLSLAYFSGRRPTSSVVSDVPPVTQEAKEAAPSVDAPVTPEAEQPPPATEQDPETPVAKPAPEPSEKG